MRAVKFGIWDWDYQKNILFWDDHMYTVFGIDQKDFTGAYDAFEKTLLQEDAARVHTELQETFKKKTDYSSEFRIKRKDGQIRIIRAEAHCIYDSQGVIQRLIGANWDITQQKEQEQSFLQNSKMSSLGEMSSGIAHEINNPLAIIGGVAQQIQRMIDREQVDLPRIKKGIETINQTVDRIAKIIHGLRSFAREGSNDPFIQSEAKKIISDTLELCKSKFLHSDIMIDVTGSNSIIHLDCRPYQISQVLLNLLNNSYDAIKELNEKWVRIETVESAQHVDISVIDSGKGIPKQLLPKIMQPFFTTKATDKGTGLGLSVASGILKSHGGSLVIDENYPNTKFTMRIPKKHEKSAA